MSFKLYDNGERDIYTSRHESLYSFTVYVGEYDIILEKGDSAYTIDKADHKASVTRGPKELKSDTVTVVIRGYNSPSQSVDIDYETYLPYVNGCSTKQLLAPHRPGDPTLQLLKIPKHSSEQAHHIHSTARVVYVLKGSGICKIGMNSNYEEHVLQAGNVCVLEPMLPHHFETPNDEDLIVIPLHIYSSVSNTEQNHPMFNGTILA